MQTRIRHVEFSLPEGQGSYQESIISVAVQPFAKWRIGGWIAPVRLSTGGETTLGVTNPVAFVEREYSIRNNLKMVVAMQLEVPLGSSAEGIASAHTEILPYLGVSYRMERLTLQLNLGLAMALGESDSHGHDHAADSDHETPLLVNPHEDKEALSRAAVLVSF
ncbi:MAG: hypothetical protein JKY56_24620, partial [Kofleriaceae bacterium]|nr:hypothetical protein [Kofleriaceae bacterium]